jgi:predicted transcriptional regulator
VGVSFMSRQRFYERDPSLKQAVETMLLFPGDIQEIIAAGFSEIAQRDYQLKEILDNLKSLSGLWDLQSEGSTPIFVSDLQEKIQSPERKWAYTTVKTVLDRLVEKGLATREKDGLRYHYRTLLGRREAAMTALDKVVRQYFKNDVNSCLHALLQQSDV